MSKLRRIIIPTVAIVGLAGSLVLLYQARASLRERDEQVQCLRQRMAQLEDDLARHSPTHPTGLTADELEAYLSLPYREFDVIYGSGHRRFRDQPRDPVQVAALIEAYFDRHPELPFDSRATLQSHAAQLFALGGMNERAIIHLDRLLAQNPADGWAAATKSFLLQDREGLLAARRRMAGGEAVRFVDLLIDHFGESYFACVSGFRSARRSACRWVPRRTTGRPPISWPKRLGCRSRSLRPRQRRVAFPPNASGWKFGRSDRRAACRGTSSFTWTGAP
jgi:hypothetical protein